MAAAVALLAALTAGAACSAADGDPAAYDLPPRPARTLETPLPHRETTLGEVRYSVLGIRTGIGDVVGSHGSWLPHGQYVRLRLAMVNDGRDRHGFVIGDQRLVTADGRAWPPSRDAMQIARQPHGDFSIARDERREFDLWFDVPAGARVRALRLAGDTSSSALADQLKGAKVAGSRDTVDIPLS